MKYKNRLIVPTVVTLSLLGLSVDASANEKNDDLPSHETIPVSEESVSSSNGLTNIKGGHELEQNNTVTEFEETEEHVTEPENENRDNQIHNSNGQNDSNNEPSDVSKSTSISETPEKSQITNDSASKNDNVAEADPKFKHSTSEMPNDSITNEGNNSEDTQHEYQKDNKVLNQNENFEVTTENLEAIDNNEDTSSPDIENETSNKDVPLEENQLHDEKNNTRNYEKTVPVNNQSTSKVIESDDEDSSAEKSGGEAKLDADSLTETQLNLKSRKEDKEDQQKTENNNKEVSSALKTFILPTSATMKAETFKKSADAAPQYEDAYYAARVASGPNSGRYNFVTSKDSKALDWLEDRTLFISQQVEYNDTTFYKIHSGINGASQGWVKSEDLRLFDMTKPANHKKTYDIRLDKHHLLTDPWGTKTQQIKRLDGYGDKAFHVEKSLNLGAHKYYYGKIDDDYGWIEQAKLVDTSKTPFYRNMKVAARVKSGGNSGRFNSVTDKNSTSLGELEKRTLFITEQAKYRGTTFYKTHSGITGPAQGWVKSEDLRLFDTTDPMAHKKDYVIYQPGHHLLSDPWGMSSQYIKQLGKYDDEIFETEKIMNLGAHTYYYGQIGKDHGWVEQSRFLDTSKTPYYKKMKVAARVKSSGNSGRYSSVTDKNSTSLGELAKKTLFITEQANYRGTTFYKIHPGINGLSQGWVKSEDLRLFDTTNPVTHKKDYVIYQPGHHLLSDPWGTTSQYIKQLSEYGDAIFRAEKSMELGAHTYYYGKIGNDYGWLEQSRVKLAPDKPVAPSPSVKTVRYNQSFNQVLNTQMNLSSKPQAWANGGGWRNATRNEVARFLDTSHQTSETWMYTFLDLDRSQNIASSTLNNRLLNGKGILNNQGSAFLNAANTQGINEVYLISHAIHETGNGTSTLAQGVRLDSNGNISSNGKKYYNMYGVAAYDYNPVLAGARYAQQMGWDTPAKAIIGGASFISQNYFNRGQTTLYSMRWNPLNPGTYQYATDVNWAFATARNLQNYYQQLGIRGQYYTKHIF